MRRTVKREGWNEEDEDDENGEEITEYIEMNAERHERRRRVHTSDDDGEVVTESIEMTEHVGQRKVRETKNSTQKTII